jgi:hypothetical protein
MVLNTGYRVVTYVEIAGGQTHCRFNRFSPTRDKVPPKPPAGTLKNADLRYPRLPEKFVFTDPKYLC